MRPIEKRIAAVEARTVNRDGLNMLLFYCPEDVDPDLFVAEREAELGHRDFRVIVWVASDGAGGLKPQPWHKPTTH